MATTAEYLTDGMNNVRQITRLYRQTRLEVLDQLERAKTEANVLRQRAILGQIDRILGQTANITRKWVDKEIPAIYKGGADQAVATVRKLGAPIKVAAGFSAAHEGAMAALSNETFLKFAEGLHTVRRTAQGTLSEAAKLQIRDEIASKGVLQGLAPSETAKSVAQVIKDRGVQSLVDRSGKTWQLDSYAEMLVRTKQREVFNTGTANRLLENGYDLAQISDHGAEDSCAEWEGEIISLTGATPGYSTLSEVENDDTHMFKPNCRHTYSVWIPGFSSD